MSLDEILRQAENTSLEFKQTVARNVAKEVAAFASSRGGTVLVGVTDDSRTVIGIGEPFERAREKLQNWIHEFVRPSPHYEIGLIDHHEVQIIVITVKVGSEPAYAFKGRYYYRNGEQSQEMPASEIARRFMAAGVTQKIKKLETEEKVAPGIAGQTELATLSYDELLQRLAKDLSGYFVSK